MSERAADVRERYRELVSDGPAFMESLLTALPSVIWPQPERLDRAGLAALFEARSEPVAWTSDALRLEGVDRPGKHWGHWTGLYYVQEEASLLPARLLDAKPGERVLDLCAAPGSKTARLAFALENRGTIVANDRKATRHAATSASLARLGLANVTTTVADGSTLPDAIGTWDCVLVDAPCTAEGNLGPRTRESGDYRTFIAGVQEALLRRALALCRPGGRVVYSTCTFAPEENEAVLDAALRAFEDVDVVEAEIDGLRTSPGIDAWRGRTFDPRVRRALRLWPHESGTGGFFAALLHKAGDGVAEGGVPVMTRAEPALASAAVQGLVTRYGVPEEAFAGLHLLARGRYARLVPSDHLMPAAAEHVASGLELARNRPRGKIATAAALRFGREATRQIIDLDLDRARAYLARERVPLRPSDRERSAGGYVIVRHGPHALGMALDRGDHLESEFPSAWR